MSDILVKIGADISDFSRKMAESNRSLTNFSKANQQTFDSFKQVGTAVTGAGVAIAGGLGIAAKQAIDFESSFAGVRKTVDASEAEFAVLEQGIRDMAKEIPASVHEINAVAEAAGQLGIEKDSILGFTRTMVDLGEATNMSSDEAAEALARFANITQMSHKDFDRLGSTIVALGNNFATTESDITAMAMRLAGAGAQVGMSEADILALATALSSVGIEAEMGGSALSRVMVNMQVATSTGFKKVQEVLKETGKSLRELEMMASHDAEGFGEMAYSLGMTKKELLSLIKAGKDLEGFSEIAGMTSDEFVKAFEQDAIGALGAFIEGLSKAEEKGESAINMLEEMGISEIRLRDSLLRAGGASALFAEAVELSNNAWEENTALTDEANQRYETVASKLAILKNTLIDIGITIGQALMPAIEAVTEFLQKLADGFSKLPEPLQSFIAISAAVVAAILLIVGPILLLIGFIPQIIMGFEALSLVLSAVGGTFSFLLGPVGLIIAAIVGIGVALVIAYQKIEWFRETVNLVWEFIKESFSNALAFIKALVTGDFEGMVEAALNQMENMSKFLDEIWKIIKEIYNSALKWLAEKTGVDFETMKDTVDSVLTTTWEIIKRIWDWIKESFKNALDFVSALLEGDFEGMHKAVTNQMENIDGTVKDIWGKVEKFFKDIDLKEVGKNIIEGLIKGIGSMKDSLKKKAQEMAGTVVKAMAKRLDTHSPSKVTEEIGLWTGEGLVIGLGKMANSVRKAGTYLAEAAVPDTPTISLAYDTPSGIRSSLSSAVSGTVNVNARDDMIAAAIYRLERKLTDLRVIMDSREVGRMVAPVVDREIEFKRRRFD